MIESIMYLGIGFLAASISVLAVVPIVHHRAVRLTTRKIADTIPSSVAEIAADKDLLRAEFAVSTRSLEMKVEQLKSKDASQLLQLGRNGSTINHLRIELDTLRDRLHVTDERLASESAALKVAEHSLAEKALELAVLMRDLAQQSIIVDGQTIEIVTLKTQVEALKVQLDANKNELQALNDRRDAEQIEFQARAKELTGALQNTERALSDKEAELSKLSRDFDAQTMVNDAQETKIAALDGEIEALRNRLDVTIADLTTAEGDRDELTAAIKETGLALFAKEADAVRLVSELSEHAALGEAQTNEIFGLKAEVETLAGRLDDAREALNAKEAEADRLVSELSEHATLEKVQTNEILGLKAEVETLTGRLDETCMALNAAEDRTYGLAVAVHRAGLVLSERDSEVAKLIGERNERSTLVHAQANEVLAFKAEIETLTARLDEACKALDAALARGQVLAAAGEKSEQALAEKQSEIAKLMGELSDRTTLGQSQASEIIGLKAEVETLTGRLDETCKALNAAEDRSQALAAAAEKSERELTAKDPELAKLIGELNERSTLAKAQANEILDLKTEVAMLTERLDEAGKALNGAEDRSQVQAAASEKAERALSVRESEVARLAGELNDRGTLGLSQANEIISLKAEVESLVGRLDEASKARNATDDRSQALATAAEKAELALSVKESEAAKLIGELNERSTLADARANEILDLKTEVETLTGRLDETCKALNAAEDRGQTQADAAAKAEIALSTKEAEAAKLAGELEERSLLADKQANELGALKVYIGALKERLDEAEKELQTVDERRAAERLELDTAIQQVMEERTKFVNFHDRVSGLVEQLLAQSREDKKLDRRARELETRLAEQSRLLEATELERKQLREEIEAALKTEAEQRSAIITEIDKHAKAENAKLQAALDRANGDRTRLVYELANAKRQAEAIKAAERPEGIVAA